MPKRLVYLILTAVWTVGVIVAAYAIKDDIGGRFKEEWLLCISMVLCAVALFVVFLRWVHQLALKAAGHPAGPLFPRNSDAGNHIELVQGMPLMSDKPKVVIQSPGNVTINNHTTHNNVQGGIIGSGTVTVHQHFDKQQTSAPPTDMQPVQSVALIPVKDTASLDDLLAHAETLMGRPIAENTIRNVLERADVESCSEEKRGRARAKVYPRVQAEKAIADYVVANKEK